MAEASERLYRVEYAKSGRASCKKCSESIPKDSLRMAIMVQVRRGWAGGAGRRGPGGWVGSEPPHSPWAQRDWERRAGKARAVAAEVLEAHWVDPFRNIVLTLQKEKKKKPGK